MSASNEPPKMEAELPLPSVPQTPSEKKPAAGSHWQRFNSWYISHKKLSIPLSFLLLLLIIFAIPLTRYPVAGLLLKKNFGLQVIDSTTKAPVSGATVSASGISTQTDGNGQANLRLRVGHHALSISKKYYQDDSTKVLVPILKASKTSSVELHATGRQVKISVKNSVSKKALANVDIKVLDITAKTDKDGQALIVLPAGSPSQKATLSLSGYNETEATLKVSDAKVETNELTLTPAGKIYFLSRLSGKIDVVKSNLDGSQRETVLAGTGKEDNQNTALLASHDWKYLALLARRDSEQAKLYLIETAADKITAIDEGNADFYPIGWSGSYFAYRVERNGYQQWQSKRSALKNVNGVDKKITLLDETDAQGSSNSDANSEIYSSTFIVGQRLVYTKSWYASYADSASLEDNQMGIYSINISGSGGRATHKTFGYSADQSTYEQSFLYKPNEVYYRVTEKGGEAKYYVYTPNQVSEKASIKDELDGVLNSGQLNVYLQSPSGNSVFWSELRDGKNTLFVGNQNAASAKQVAAASDFETYGWFSDDYLLASKNGSELYIFSTDGIKKDTDALKITDYHKPNTSFLGYGGM